MKLTGKRLLHVLISGFIIAGFSVLSACQGGEGRSKENVVIADSVVVVKKEFGIPVDSFRIFKATIGRNQFLSSILSAYGVSAAEVSDLVRKSKKIFDVRNMQAGKPYTVFCPKDDTLNKAAYFVYQPTPIDYVVYNFQDSIRVYEGKLPVVTKEQSSAGVIENSLFAAMDRAGASSELAINLAKIYAWDIDFYSIQKGDWFKVIYDQDYVKGEPVGMGRVKAAVFSHGGEKFYAFYFKNDSANVEDYFDENAKSLRKAFLKAPLKFYRISSHYSRHRFHPVQHRWKAHLGTDYAAPTGTPIMTTAAGVVIASRYTRFNGNYVKVRHNATYTTQYLHMSKRAVKVGQHVKQGQVIGYVGMTGLATGPHVCYRFWKNGKQVDPLKQHFPPAKPVDKNDLADFKKLVQREKLELDSISINTIDFKQPV